MGLLALGGCQAPDVPAWREDVRGVVSGVVVDALTERPLVGVRVRAWGQPTATHSDARGRFELSLPTGEHLLVLDREGYLEGQRANVRVEPDRVVDVDPRVFPSAPRDEDIHAYFARQPVRRHAHPAHERPEPLAVDDDDVGRAVLALDGIPETIRVWRSNGTPLQPTSANGWADRSCDPEAVVLELPREEYVKGVVPHEWIPSWHPEALRAGAVAARTFAVRWALRGGRWDCADVDDGTVTQVYRDDRNARANEAVDATSGMVVTRDGQVISTEYSAENSDPTANGVAEPTCTGTTRFGHGRGMCQWGTHRWASSICANPPCDFGAFGDAPKDHVWLVDHYFPGSAIEVGEPPVPCTVLGPNGGILEEDGPCFEQFGPARYWRSEAAGSGGHLLWTNAFEASSPSNWGRWRIHLGEPARFRVAVYVDSAWGVWSQTRYVVTHAGGETVVVIDQGASDGWVDLGEFDFVDGGAVRIEDSYAVAVPADQRMVADALRLSPPGAHGDGGALALDERAREAERRNLTGGCSVVGGGSRGSIAVLLVTFVLVLVRRRRRGGRRQPAARGESGESSCVRIFSSSALSSTPR
jgi:hypothetical protein